MVNSEIKTYIEYADNMEKCYNVTMNIHINVVSIQSLMYLQYLVDDESQLYNSVQKNCRICVKICQQSI